MRFFNTPKFGIRLMAAWSATLTLLAIANLMFLSEAIVYSNEYENPVRVWIIFILNVAFGLSFAAAAYGLWLQQNWGRLLFLWTIGAWAAFNTLALTLPGLIFGSAQTHAAVDLIGNLVRFSLTLLFPLFYLNRTRIKNSFFAGISPDNSVT
jgi:hypothetical protein